VEKMKMKKTKSLAEQADEILKQAESKGVNTNFFFKTTFQRYTVQMKIMSELQKQIEIDGATVTKEYVKGRKNVYTNPAITEYNKTATAANGTVATLMNILRNMSAEDVSATGLTALLDRLNTAGEE
jgi:hypothetical protein